MDRPSSSHFTQHVDSDLDDAEYIAPSTEDEESSEEEEDISSDEGDDGQDVRAVPQLQDMHRRETHRSLRSTFHIPIIEVGNSPGDFFINIKFIPNLSSVNLLLYAVSLFIIVNSFPQSQGSLAEFSRDISCRFSKLLFFYKIGFDLLRLSPYPFF
ncbi:unnamed protein product [Cuscuta campestris]|uniref:Uncharacterized protein n=1 Tax=Cuscuta campestris TaxID=132261 RepID=A0A484N4Y7_9ASTE|nr:unnamed protein product [Cuscuta campestris]